MRRALVAVAAGLALGGAVTSQAPRAEAASRMPPSEGFADLVERLTPAVVNIASTIRVPSAGEREKSELKDIPQGQPRKDFFEFFGEGGPEGEPEGDPEAFPAASLGSGFIIDPAGLVVTNNHVIADADEISVVLDDGRRLKATVIGRDTKTDLVLLKVDAGKPLPHVNFGNSDQARVGDWVIAIGNPFGLGNSVSAGIVSARGRDINAGPYDDFLQTDAPINRGNSGGPMFDIDGNVIGVNTLIYSPSGGSVGIGFATPASIAKPVIDQLKRYGSTRRGWIGVRLQLVSDELAARLGLPRATGALVASVIGGGPAANAGIKTGDVILRFNGKSISGRRTLPRVVADTEVGRAVDVVIWRDRKETTLKIALGHLEDFEKTEEASVRTPKSESTEPKEARPGEPMVFSSLGVTLADLDASLRSRFGLKTEDRGVVVVDADKRGDLVPGDVIVELDRHRIERVTDVWSALALREKADQTPVIVLRQRNREREFVVIPPTTDWKPQG